MWCANEIGLGADIRSGGRSVLEVFVVVGGGGRAVIVVSVKYLMQDGEYVVIPLEIVLECRGEEVVYQHDCFWCRVLFEDGDGNKNGLIYTMYTMLSPHTLNCCCRITIFFFVIHVATSKLVLNECNR